MLNFFCVCLAQEPSPAEFNAFDGPMPSARALAMGYAFCAVATDISAAYYNPAALAETQSNTLSMTYEIATQSDAGYEDIVQSDMLRNQNLIFLAFGGEKGSFSWRPLANANFRKIQGSDFNDVEIKLNSYSISVSHRNDSGVYSGLSLSYLNGRIGSAGTLNNNPFANITDGNGFAADLGFLFKPSEELRLAIVFKNLFGFVWWDDYEKDHLPFSLRGGFSFQFNRFITFSSDFEKRFYRKDGMGEVQTTHFGIEQSLGKILCLRTGIYGTDLSDKNASHLTAGLGYQKNNYNFSISGEKYRVNNADVFRYVFSLDLPL